MWWMSCIAMAHADPSAAEQKAASLRAELPDTFTVLVQEPWVVVGDEAPELVKARAVSTVQWATERLTASYFSAPPSEVWTIWLFKDDASYTHHAQSLWGDTPETPYGYAAHSDLVMNIGTGGGTLVHEMVHPYLDTNFPGVPPWFNEGLASLYEQSTDRGGRIVGLPNWRLAGLQEAVKADTVPSFATLMAQDRDGFYDRDPGTNYAQARYLLLWLQGEGLLGTYYRAFHAARDADPTGLTTLKEVAKITDMRKFEKDWSRWVLGLRYP